MAKAVSADPEFPDNDLIWFDPSVKIRKQPLSQKPPLAFRHAGVCAGVARAARFESSDPQTLKPSNRS